MSQTGLCCCSLVRLLVDVRKGHNVYVSGEASKCKEMVNLRAYFGHSFLNDLQGNLHTHRTAD